MNKKIEIDAEKLYKASKHLHYEFTMLMDLAQVLSSGKLGSNLLKNAALESFIIHARALLDFFYPENPKADDVQADHFVTEVEKWRSARPVKSRYLKKAHTRAHKEVAHLTYTRLEVKPEEKKWDTDRIATEISEVFKIFRNYVPKHHLCKKWEIALEMAKVKGKELPFNVTTDPSTPW